MRLEKNQRVEVKWAGRGWLPGVFVAYNTPEPDESFERCVVAMDNGWACQPPGFAPVCVRPVRRTK